MILFSGGLNNEQEARNYIKKYELTKTDVKLVKGNDYINVVSRDNIPWELSEREEIKATKYNISILYQKKYSINFIKCIFPNWDFEGEKL